jgi:hypothetical protein
MSFPSCCRVAAGHAAPVPAPQTRDARQLFRNRINLSSFSARQARENLIDIAA